MFNLQCHYYFQYSLLKRRRCYCISTATSSQTNCNIFKFVLEGQVLNSDLPIQTVPCPFEFDSFSYPKVSQTCIKILRLFQVILGADWWQESKVFRFYKTWHAHPRWIQWRVENKPVFKHSSTMLEKVIDTNMPASNIVMFTQHDNSNCSTTWGCQHTCMTKKFHVNNQTNHFTLS